MAPSSELEREVHHIDNRVVAIETELKTQFRDVYNRLKRLENLVVWAGAGVIAFLATVVGLLLEILGRLG